VQSILCIARFLNKKIMGLKKKCSICYDRVSFLFSILLGVTNDKKYFYQDPFLPS
jgi:hypothetical protein